MTARRPRAPGFAFAGISGVLLAVIGALAFTAQSVTPPAIAELAPQAARQITKTAQQQGADTGVGSEVPGVGPGPAASPSPQPSPTAAVPQASAAVTTRATRRCVGDPLRQTEDPQSPPCVPFWDGNNGGATWKGVSASEIRVAVGNQVDGTTGQPIFSAQNLKAYETYFNRRYEFYGRRLRLIPFTPAGPGSTAVAMTNDAVQVDKQIGAFAALMYSEQDGRQYVYYDALAQRKVLGVMTGLLGIGRTDEAHLRSFAPYQWDYTPTADRLFRGYGEFYCAVLAGRQAAYSGTPQAQRVLGVMVDTAYRDTPPYDITPFKNALAKCGVKPVVVEWDETGAPTAPLAKLAQAKVTSVMYTGQSGVLGLRVMSAATAQNYYPEWLVGGLGYQDSDAAAQYYPSDHRARVLGLQVYSKTLTPADAPYYYAAKEADPAALSGRTDSLDSYMRLYSSLLLLASGVQGAGPQLTPARFEQALFNMDFPNPGAGGPPFYQGRVGFPRVHSMQQDLTMVWLSDTDPSPVSQRPPSYCYVQLGRRYGLGEWTRQEPQFRRPPCR